MILTTEQINAFYNLGIDAADMDFDFGGIASESKTPWEVMDPDLITEVMEPFFASVWEHGEELRRWHNIKYQIRDEGAKANETGAVINPAIISIG